MEKSMRALKTTKDIGWIRVDSQPLKKSLESLVSKWSYLYIKYLQVSLHVKHKKCLHLRLLKTCCPDHWLNLYCAELLSRLHPHRFMQSASGMV
jgi:hypothetical protein